MPCSETSADTAGYLQLLLADGRLPTGAHTQSAGAEPAFLAGMPLARVPELITTRLRTVTEVEAATAVVARACWLRNDLGSRLESMARVDAAWRARTLPDAARAASDSLGRGFARLARAVWGVDLGPMLLCRAVVVGATCGAAGLGPEQTATLVGFDDVQTVIAAALKLEPFDPLVGVRWAVDAADEVKALVGRVADAESTADIPARSAPLLEEWAQRHATEERRLYRA